MTPSRVRVLLRAAGISQAELARRIGTTPAYLCRAMKAERLPKGLAARIEQELGP